MADPIGHPGGLPLRAHIRQGKLQLYMKIKKPIEISDANRSICVNPSDRFAISYHMSFDHTLFTKQSFSFCGDETRFIQEISKARTFGFLKDVERLRSSGLIKGGSLQNAVVIGEYGIMNEGGLRYPDELVRHKILDLMGDLALLEKPLIGQITVDQGGHALHTRLVSALQKHKEAWTLVQDLEDPAVSIMPARWAVAPRIS